MTDQRFNELLNGPLSHPVFLFQIARLGAALKYVVEQTGEPGDRALEQYCADRDRADEAAGDGDPDL